MSKDYNSIEKSKRKQSSADSHKKPYLSLPINYLLKFRGERPKSLNQKLNEELMFSYNKIILTKKETSQRELVFQLFKETIEKEFDCTVESHGSFRAGTCVYGSDIDITILTKDGRSKLDEVQYKPHANKILSKIAQIIEKNKLSSGPVMHIKHARVPIVKCVDKQSKCKIDIVIDKYDSIETANFVLQQLSLRPYLKYFVVLLKYFLKRRQLSEVIRGGLCSYAQFLLILNFLQLHPIVQSEAITVEENLGTLFMDFFQFYGTEFPFEKASISVLDSRYKPNKNSQVCIEDPVTPGHNVAGGCTSLHMIREIFTFSYKIMAAAFAEKVDTKRAIGELWLRLDQREFDTRGKAK